MSHRSKICWRTIGRGAYRAAGGRSPKSTTRRRPRTTLQNNTDFHATVTAVMTTTSFHARCLFHNSSADCCRFWSAASCWSGPGKSEWKRRSRGMCPVPSSSRNGPTLWKRNCGVDTMHNRPILNTRDEPHADRTKYRRLHLILGDANMCEYATASRSAPPGWCSRCCNAAQPPSWSWSSRWPRSSSCREIRTSRQWCV